MQVFVDNFNASDIDREGKLYTNVSRTCMDSADSHIVLDHHSVLCRIEEGSAVEIRIFTGLESEVECDYLVSGKVYQIEERADGRVLLRASFGGLLLLLDTPKERIQGMSDRSDISLALSLI